MMTVPLTVLLTLLVLCLTLPHVGSQQTLPVSEVLALRKIYEDMNGVNWVQSFNGIPWNFSLPDADTHPCRPNEEGLIWQRVQCAERSNPMGDAECFSENCTIVSLDFYSLYSLVGVVPDEITQLTSLSTLYFGEQVKMSETQLPSDKDGKLPVIISNLTSLVEFKMWRIRYGRVVIPDEYSKLVNLEVLHFIDCNITSPIPLGLTNLVNLQEFRLRENFLYSTLPDELFQDMTQLTYLDIAINKISGTLPSSMKRLRNLELLDFSNNFFNSTLYDFDMPLLKDLIVYNNEFTGTFPFMKGNLTSLELLSASQNFFTGSLPDELQRLSSVRRIRLTDNFITGTIPDIIGGLSALSRLEFGRNSMVGSIPSSLGNLPWLEYLELEENRLTSSLPYSLGRCTLLRRFRVNNNNITGSIPDSLSDLKRLQQFYVHGNSLTSSLPVDFVNMTGLMFFHISDNSITGTLPILENFQKLLFLNVSFNLFTGSIPSTICSVQRLQDIEFQNNAFTGTIPECIGSMTALKYLRLEHNSMRGGIPHGIENMNELIHINLEANNLVSTIPQSLGQLPNLIYLYLADNYFTGTMPESLSLLIDTLQDLDVGGNNLIGTIPSSLGLLSKLNLLAVSYNHFTGQIPVELSNLSQLRILQLDRNYFSGPLDRLFSSTVNMTELQVFDGSDNEFTGSLPEALFMNSPKLTTVSLSLNCFSGTLPAQICSAKHIRVLSFDGMGSSPDCDGYGDVFFNFFKPQGLSGSIPDCMLAMPSLVLLHLSANALTGSIPSGEFSRSLRNISLSHNHLSSTIPYSFQRGQLRKLDLSHNKLTGVWQRRQGDISINQSVDSDNLLSSRMEVKLTVNRLSGNLPSPIRFKSIDVLKGNLFGCGFTLPEHDPSRSDYVCGSSQLGQSLYFLLAGVCSIVMVLVVFSIYRLHRSSLKSKDLVSTPLASLQDVEKVQEVKHISMKIQEEIDKGRNQEEFVQCTNGSSSGVGRKMLPLEIGSDTLSESRRPKSTCLGCVSILSILSPSVYLYIFFLRCVDESNLPNIRLFQRTLDRVTRYVVAIMCLGVLLAVPVFALKWSEEGKESYEFTTHTHTYGWVLSTAFVTGYVPSLLMLGCWGVLIYILVACFWSKVLPSADIDLHDTSTLLPSASCAPNPLCCDRGIVKKAGSRNSNVSRMSRVSHCHNHHFIRSERIDTIRMWSMLMVNVLIVGSVNGLYIYSTLQAYSPESNVLIQYAVALFKIMWDAFIVPALFHSRLAVSGTRARLKLFTLMFNSIVVPCLVTMCSSPTCFQGVFVRPHKISSTYTVTVCDLFSFSSVEFCDHFVSKVITITAFYPPFSYNYLCSSTILTAYIPVFLYSYTFLLFLPVFHFVMVRLVPPRRDLSWRDSLFRRLVKVLPGIVWPDIWSHHDLVEVKENKKCEKEPGEARETIHENSTFVISSRQLLKPDDIAASLMHHTAVLLTFGATCPVLAMLVTITICSQALQWVMLLNRFVFKRLQSGGMWEASSVAAALQVDSRKEGDVIYEGSGCNEASRSGKLRRDEIVGAIIASIESEQQGLGDAMKFKTFQWEKTDVSLRRAEGSVEQFDALLSLCILPVVCISTVFFVFFSWDIAADRLGFLSSLWVPIVALLVPCVVIARFKYFF